MKRLNYHCQDKDHFYDLKSQGNVKTTNSTEITIENDKETSPVNSLFVAIIRKPSLDPLLG